MSNRATAATLAVAIAFTALLFLPLPDEWAAQRWPALVDELRNLGHPLLFGMLAHMAFRLLRKRNPAPALAPYLVVLLGTVFLGLATEGLQRLAGRDSAWIDLANDVLGASFVLLLHARYERRARSNPANGILRDHALVAAAVIVAMLATGPFLWTLAAYGYRAAQAPVLWRADSMLFERFARQQARYSAGLALVEPVPDWTGYRTLVIEVRNLREDVSVIRVRVHDRQHDQEHADRFHQEFELPAGAARTLRISLDQIRRAPAGREMDMAAIKGVHIFQPIAKEALRFSVREIRLER